METVFSVLGILLFILLFAIGLLFLSATVVLKLKTHEGLQGVITLSLSLFFASKALYPITSLAYAIRISSYANPVSYLLWDYVILR